MAAKAPAFFIADTPGLDFLNSLAMPVDRPIDWISDGDGLIDWIRQAGLVSEEVLDEIATRAIPGELDRVAEQARDMREWFRGFVSARMGRSLNIEDAKHLAPLNRLLERDEAFGRIAPYDGGGGRHRLVLETLRRWRTPEALLLPIGWAMARTVVEEDFRDIKACSGHKCSLLFADHTRGRRRRWCSMSVCGNRAKVSAHRSRAKSD